MFLLTILKEDVGNDFLRPVDTLYHSHTRFTIVEFETLHPELFLSHLQCEDSLYTLYPSTCPTNKTCMGSPVTNEEVTILFITWSALQVNFHCRGSNLVNIKATISTHPFYYYCYSVTKNNLPIHSIVNRWKFNKWCQNACERSVWIYGPWKTMYNTILTALLANYTTTST